MVVRRRAFSRTPEGYRFIDAENNAPDGAVFRESAQAYGEVLRLFADKPTPGLAAFRQDYPTYHLYIQSSTGRTLNRDIPASALPLTAHAEETMRAIESSKPVGQ